VRADKLALAALEATVTGPAAPVTAYLHADPDQLRARCGALAASAPPELRATVVEADGVVGGGGAPGLTLPGWAVALPEDCAPRLRAQPRPVLARVDRGRCLVDLRCIPPDADRLVAEAISQLA
jgi:L-seryl-tRNA(Ser) seleniumtransferase